MRKKVTVVFLCAMVSVLILSHGHPAKYMAEDDKVIEWQSYRWEWII